MLLSFHGDKTIKAKYVARVKAHAKADELVKGGYWGNGKGCAVGCTIHSSQHNAYETELGLPEWLARLEDTLFEGLANKYAKKFAVEFLLSIPVGKNLDKVKWQFCSFILAENLKRVQQLQISEALKVQVSEAIRGLKAMHDKATKTGVWDESAAWSAARSAESAAWSAWSAAWSAARSAESAAWSVWSAARSAESAAWSAAWSAARSAESAESAESAAWSAARSVWSAESAAQSAARSAESAESAARSAAYKRYANKLLKLLKEAK